MVIEKSETGFSAFSPDIPGCITVGNNVERTIANMQEAINLYIETLVEDEHALSTGKGVEYHIKNGLLKEGEFVERYFTQIEILLPEIA